jgi:hypothetical protein
MQKNKHCLSPTPTFFLFLLVIILSGCGGGGGSSADNGDPAVGGGNEGGAPTITSSPNSQVTTVGDSALFSVTATGEATLTYQWLKDDTSIGGATNSAFSIRSAVSGDAGNYKVTITNNVGEVTSSTVTLAVNEANLEIPDSWEDQFSLDTLNLDVNGWSNLTPAADSRIVFVSNSGDDSTGQVYDMSNSSDAAFIGADPHSPSGVVNAFKTIVVAMKNVRNNMPDWVVLKRGDTWIRDEHTAEHKLIYYDYNTGTDDTGTVYSVGDSEIGSDPSDPVGVVNVYKNAWFAKSRVAAESPYILFQKSGDKWARIFTDTRIAVRAGRSLTERSVITYYGTDTARPLIKTGTGPGISFSTVSYAAVVGINFYANKRDPNNSSDFTSFDDVKTADGFFMYASGSNSEPTKSIFIEDCVFNFYGGNGITDAYERASTDIIIRRSQIINSYHPTGGMSQGLIAPNTSLLLEESLLDHNGWFKADDPNIGHYKIVNGVTTDEWVHDIGIEGQATVFNHNTYMGATENTIFRNNIFARESSLSTKFAANSPKIYYDGEGNLIPDDELDGYEKSPGGHIIIKPGIITADDKIMALNILVDNNFYFGGEIAMSIGGNWDWNTGYRFQNINVINNVLMGIGRAEKSNGRTSTDRNVGWGMEIKDWNTGRISNNYLINYGDTVVTNTYGIDMKGHFKDVDVDSNVIANISGNGAAIRINGDIGTAVDGGPKEGVRVFDNQIKISETNTLVIDTLYNVPGTFFGNTYDINRNSDLWFKVDGVTVNISDWLIETGDTSTTGALNYLEPTVSLASYNASLGGVETAEAFFEEAQNQSRFNWDIRYTAKAVNNYFRAGFSQ